MFHNNKKEVHLMSIITVLNPPTVKKNVVAWKSATQPGLRTNWFNGIMGLLLLIEGYVLYKLRNDFNGWSYSGLIVLGLLALCWYVIHNDKSDSAKWTALVVGMTLGFVIDIVSQFVSVSWSGVAAGLLFAALVVTWSSITLTTWYPNQRETKNRGE